MRTFDVNRAQGVLLGLAAGDKNLGPTEMALMVAESLIAQNGFDSTDITHRWLAWWRRGAWDTGRVFDAAMILIDLGEEPIAAAKAVHDESGGMTAGCNGAHRVPVLAAYPGIRNGDLDIAANGLTRITHYHAVAAEAAIAVTRICRRIIIGSTVEEAVAMSLDGLGDEIISCLDAAKDQPGGRDGYSPHTLQSAVYFAITRSTFDAALEDALAYAGSPNYCPVLVGVLAGALHGASSISSEMLSHCRDKNRVQSVARELTLPIASR